MSRLQAKKIAGQGLIETMIALLILAGCVVALVKFQNYLSYSNDMARQRAEAVVLATNEIETLRNFAVINTQSPYNSYQAIASGSSSANGANASYSLTWTVTTSTTTPTYKTINLIVSWTDRYGNAQSITMTTIIAGIDPANSATVITSG